MRKSALAYLPLFGRFRQKKVEATLRLLNLLNILNLFNPQLATSLSSTATTSPSTEQA